MKHKWYKIIFRHVFPLFFFLSAFIEVVTLADDWLTVHLIDHTWLLLPLNSYGSSKAALGFSQH